MYRCIFTAANLDKEFMELHKCLYKELSVIISRVDPGHLGGAANEYEKDINEIIRLVLEQDRTPSILELKNIFITCTGDFVSLEDQDAKDLIRSIEECLIKHET